MSVSIGPTAPRGEDLPYSDGEPMESDRHVQQMWLLANALKSAWADRDDVYVAADMALYFSETQAKRRDFRAPDVFVVLDTHNHERKSWVVWEEDGRAPDVVVEITSPSTEAEDRGPKMDAYARLVRVPTYIIYDPITARLDVFQLDAADRRYEPVAPDARGYFYIRGLGLHVGVVRGRLHGIEAPWLRWIDPQGQPLYEPFEIAQRAAKRAEEEANRADEATKRADRLEAELAELKARLEKR